MDSPRKGNDRCLLHHQPAREPMRPQFDKDDDQVSYGTFKSVLYAYLFFSGTHCMVLHHGMRDGVKDSSAATTQETSNTAAENRDN